MSVSIYKITSIQTDKVYIGSTKLKLKRRFKEHKKKRYTSREILKYDDARIELIEECCFETRFERERYYIDLYGDKSVNTQKPLRTRKQYYEDTKEFRRESKNARNREYYQLIKEEKNAKARFGRTEFGKLCQLSTIYN